MDASAHRAANPRWATPGVLFVPLALAVAACAPSTNSGSDAEPAPPAAFSPAGAVCPGEPSAVVTFPDEQLFRAVRMAAGVGPDAALTCAALARVTRLDVADAGIESLSGIENLIHLSELHVYGQNSIADLTPIGLLPALVDLSLPRNDIEDVSALAAVGTLTSLDLYGNPIRDVRPLGRLTGLVRLRLGSGERVEHLEALAALPMLTRLELFDNAVADVGSLATLTHLMRLSLRGNSHLSDIAPLRTLVNLEILELEGTAVADIRPLGALTRLTTLGLAGTRVHDLGPLIGLPDLSRLDLRGNMQLSDVQPLLFHPTFGDGDAVRLEQTGVRCGDIAALEAKGVVIFSTCR